MANPENSESRAYLRLVLGTFSFIGVLTALNAVIIMNSVGSNIFKPLQRNIASVSVSQPQIRRAVPAPTVKIDCRERPSKIHLTTLATNTRFVFSHCPSVGRLLNKANNNQGDIFPLKNKIWTSDFIALAPGKNSIIAPLGKTSQVIEITREKPKPPPSNKAL